MKMLSDGESLEHSIVKSSTQSWHTALITAMNFENVIDAAETIKK